MRKHIYIVYTGGTIGMQKTADGYQPVRGFLAQQLATMPEFRSPIMPNYTIHEYNPLRDSVNITPADWETIAQDILRHYDKYDGFVVLHGTDTMAYSASALTFLLQGLTKTVILTGSQIPLGEPRSNAHANVITSLRMAAHSPAVCLYFNNALLRCCRSTKMQADQFAAFASPNFPPLGHAGMTITINWELVRTQISRGDQRHRSPTCRPIIGALRLFPGLSIPMLHNMLLPPLMGLVLETYGVGNCPTHDPRLLEELAAAIDRGVVIVNCTQCLQGRVDMKSYATGSALDKIGVVSGADMTIEAALTKMYYLFSRGYTSNEVTQLFRQNLCGELTPS